MKALKIANSIQVAFVDDEDYPLLSRYSWSFDFKGYVKTSAFGTTVKLHRMILNPSKNDQVDHINMNKLDNRKSNLRICNNTLNQANTVKRTHINGKKTSSKYKGVHWRKDIGKWVARISHQNQRINLGYFDDEKEAAKVYNEKALKIWGEFARINQIEGE